MIFFKPTVNTKKENVILFEAIENDAVFGKCTLEINGDKAEITALDCDSERLYLVEGLIKSAFNYAALKSCYMGYCSDVKYAHILDRMSFNKLDGVYCNDIPSILTGNCCKNH